MSSSPAQPKKLLVIVGPTATGKTALGLRLAKKLNGEIVSADSRQVYRGMDIGTGKDLPEKSKIKNQKSKIKIKNNQISLIPYPVSKTKIWLYDLINPDYRFSVADYLEAAAAVIGDIRRRGKLPVIVGGTGFYVKALLEGVSSVGVEPDWQLRDELSGYSVDELLRLLEKIDPERSRRMNESDRANPRRLVRALEIAKNIQKNVTPGVCAGTLPVWKSLTGSLVIGLKTDLPILYGRIDRRVDQRFKAGLLPEIKKLLTAGYRWDNSVLGSTIGYKEWQPYFEPTSPRDTCDTPDSRDTRNTIQTWKYHEHAYARRQLTWFRKMSAIDWYDIANPGYHAQVEQAVSQWYNS